MRNAATQMYYMLRDVTDSPAVAAARAAGGPLDIAQVREPLRRAAERAPRSVPDDIVVQVECWLMYSALQGGYAEILRPMFEQFYNALDAGVARELGDALLRSQRILGRDTVMDDVVRPVVAARAGA